MSTTTSDTTQQNNGDEVVQEKPVESVHGESLRTEPNPTEAQSANGEDKLQQSQDNNDKKQQDPDRENHDELAERVSVGSLSDADIDIISDDDENNENNENHDEADTGDCLDGDTWIEELECALLADCDPATLKKISEGRRIPSALRPDYWRALLALNDTVTVKLTGEYDLENQLDIRHDCEKLVDDIASSDDNTEPLSDADKLQLRSDFESTITTYVKARPELCYVSNNGWTDILRVIHFLKLTDIQLYNLFFRIVDRYIPKDLTMRPKRVEPTTSPPQPEAIPGDQKPNPRQVPANVVIQQQQDARPSMHIPASSSSSVAISKHGPDTSRVQAYHLLRLLIQYHDPELCSILDSKKVTPNLYVRDWFCTLFARSCSAKLALLIWDTHFKMADPFLIFFAAIVMVVNASDELKKNNMNQEKMLNALNSMPGLLQEDDVEDLYYLVSNHYTNLTPKSIRSYSHLFFMDTFGNTYQGNESLEDGQPMLDLKTIQLTQSLDLSQYLCLPVVPAEIFALDTAQIRCSPTSSASALRYFLVDCRPAEQYNAGHVSRAFHLDCSLMLREPSSFATAVQVLLDIQRQVVASKSNTGGQHLCFIGSGHEEEDQYVNMVVASLLQRYQKYVSIVVGGFEAIHDYVSGKNELKSSFSKYIVDHNPDLCKPCYTKSPAAFERYNARKADLKNSASGTSLSSAQTLFASTTNFFKSEKGAQASATANMIAQSGVSMFDKFTTAFVSRSSVFKDKLVESLNTTTLQTPTLTTSAMSNAGRDHVSSQDPLGRRYTGGNLRYAIDDEDLGPAQPDASSANDPGSHEQEFLIDGWQKQMNIIAFYKCAQIKGSYRYPGYIALSKTHLWILRDIPHNKGFATVAAKRPLDMVVQITSKRRQPELIIFRYGYANRHNTGEQETSSAAGGCEARDRSKQVQNQSTKPDDSGKSPPSVIASDHLHIPQAFDLIRLIKREIVRIMDESSRSSKDPPPTLFGSGEKKSSDGGSNSGQAEARALE